MALTAYLRPKVMVGEGSDRPTWDELTVADIVDLLPASEATRQAGGTLATELLGLEPDAATVIGAETMRARLNATLAGPLVVVGDWTAIATHGFLHQVLHRLADRRPAGLGDQWRMELRLLEPLPAAVDGQRGVARLRITEVANDQIRFSYLAQGRIRHGSVRASVDRYGVVAAALVDIRPGDLVDAEMVQFEERLLPLALSELYFQGDRMPRLEATRALRAGELLSRDHLRAVRAVSAGEEVMLRFARGAVEVTLPGRATQSANLGALVRARISLGGEVFTGVAIAEGEVLIELP